MSPLVVAWRQRAPSVHALMPVVDGERGHPLLLSGYAIEQVSATARHLGIRDWLRRHPEAVQPVHTARRAYVTDVDTPDDLVALQALVHPALVAWPAQSPCSAAGASRPAPSISAWPPAPDPLDPPTDQLNKDLHKSQ